MILDNALIFLVLSVTFIGGSLADRGDSNDFNGFNGFGSSNDDDNSDSSDSSSSFAPSASSSATFSNFSSSSAIASASASATSSFDSSSNDLVLDSDAVQTGSQSDGTQASGAEDGQAASQTDAANFINFCAGKTLTNGLQVEGGSCNGIVMGDIPSTGSMVSTIITSPENNEDVDADSDFTVEMQVSNLAAGSFTNPDVTYYAAPQELDDSGSVIGHTHVTIQDMGDSLNPSSALDATQFAFFKGIDDAGDGNGGLSVDVTGGLPTGNYRVCTMSSSSNHQPVLMPIAQRGAQDDCVRFTVGQGSSDDNNNKKKKKRSAKKSVTKRRVKPNGGDKKKEMKFKPRSRFMERQFIA
ncbi:MAG: hypothetical protein M1834_006454 [Cirrosporium novae-zelandiae]|nr:MAG: hypothetical protein M1834_006454 [Cirrosporium novae-zelandiae]